MKRISVTLLGLLAVFMVNAQTSPTDSLQHYVGKYKFPAGSAVEEVNVTVDKDMLYISSTMGSSELKKINGDVFELVAYQGLTTFKRSPEGKVNAIRIEVGETLLEGPKSEPAVSLLASIRHYPAGTCIFTCAPPIAIASL